MGYYTALALALGSSVVGIEPQAPLFKASMATVEANGWTANAVLFNEMVGLTSDDRAWGKFQGGWSMVNSSGRGNPSDKMKVFPISKAFQYHAHYTLIKIDVDSIDANIVLIHR